MNTDIYAAKYVPIGYRTLSPDEFTARRTAQDLKNASQEAIQIAAPVMAALIDGPSVAATALISHANRLTAPLRNWARKRPKPKAPSHNETQRRCWSCSG